MIRALLVTFKYTFYIMLIFSLILSQGGLAQPSVVNSKNQGMTLELSLKQCILLALAKNYGVKINQISSDFSKQNINEAKSQFDPNVFVRYSVEDSFNPSVGSNESLQVDTQRVGLGVDGNTPWGTRYTLSVNMNTRESDSLLPSDTSRFSSTLEVAQPLLKGAGRNEVYAAVRLAKNRYKASKLEFSSQLMSLVQNVVNTYTDLYAAQRVLDVAEENRDLAKRTLEDEKERVAIGRSAESDVFRPAASYARREDDVIRARQGVKFRENQLKNLIANDTKTLSALKVIINSLPHFEENLPSVYSDFESALKARPDYKLAQLDIDQRKLEIKRDKNRLLPELNLIARYDKFGHANESSFSSAYDDFNEQKFDDIYVGLEFSMPLSNKGNRARYTKSTLQLTRDQLDFKQLEKSILLDLDTAAFNLESNWQRMQAANNTVELAKQSLNAEERKMAVGRSSSFYVLDLQSRLAGAQSQQVNTIASYYKSIAEYEWLKGNILNFYNINIATAF